MANANPRSRSEEKYNPDAIRKQFESDYKRLIERDSLWHIPEPEARLKQSLEAITNLLRLNTDDYQADDRCLFQNAATLLAINPELYSKENSRVRTLMVEVYEEFKYFCSEGIVDLCNGTIIGPFKKMGISELSRKRTQPVNPETIKKALYNSQADADAFVIRNVKVINDNAIKNKKAEEGKVEEKKAEAVVSPSTLGPGSRSS